MANATDTITATKPDGTKLTTTLGALTKSLECWVWAHDSKFGLNSDQYDKLTDDLRLALAALNK